MQGDVFRGVMQRNRELETVYEPSYQSSGLIGAAGRQQDTHHYRVYFEYEYSVTFFISMAFSFLVIRVIGEITETFSEPQVMWHIAINGILTYLYGCFALHKSHHREELFFDMIKYAYLFLFYAKSYPYGQNLLPAFTLHAAMLNKALWYMSNISFQHERLLMTTQRGFSEALAMSLN